MKTAKEYIVELDNEIKETEKILIEKYGAESLENAYGSGLMPYIDEEERVMESLSHVTGKYQPLSTFEEPLIKMLDHWTERVYYPKEWVEYLINKVIKEMKK